MASNCRYKHSRKLLLLWICVTFILSLSMLLLVEAARNFTIHGEEYSCYDNLLCLGDAHIYTGTHSNGFSGTLSLIHLDERSHGGIAGSGIAYYKEPIRLLDPHTQRSASFNTSFQIFEVPVIQNGSAYRGDGMTFVLSADNSSVSYGAQMFGFFDENGLTSFKSVVIEFDNYQNDWPIIYDINNNHVSIDIHNITAVVARDASDVGTQLWNETPVNAWVEYSANMQTLEVRISYQKSRPIRPFLSLKNFNLSGADEEYMWVGFTGSNGLLNSSYYVGNWSFESYGIPAEVYHEARRKRKWGVVFGTAAGGVFALVVALVLVLALWFLRRRGLQLQERGVHRRFPVLGNMNNSFDGLHGNDFHLSPEGYQFSHKELSEATKGFSDEMKLGEGGFGCVYRGELLKFKFPVGVKKITSESQQGEKGFKAEVSIISQVRHRNLIRLLGWCIHEGKHYIVYDLMPNGSLDKVLFTTNHKNFVGLAWAQRFKIIRGTANAVEYLHHGWNQQILHRDIKASNIMLDDHWNAKLGDFGLARLSNHHQTPHTTMVAGTPGYIAPEAMSSRKFTEKTDVFAFGVLALEIACGRRCITLHMTEEMFLVDWVWQRFSEGNLLSVVDKRLSEFDMEQMETLLLLGLICSHPDPLARPSMRVVVQILYGDAPPPSVPTLKPSSIDKISRMDSFFKRQHQENSARTRTQILNSECPVILPDMTSTHRPPSARSAFVDS